jgi:hypothetical protein
MPDDQTIDPSQYATPNQLAAQRLYARQLLDQPGTITPSAGGAVSPFQGMAGILQAYAGRKQLEDAANQERQTNIAGAHAKGSVTTDGTDPDQGGPLTTQPPGPGSLVDKLLPAIAGNEGNGSYTQLGPITKTGDRAYGKYQVMGNNIPQWTKEILGAPMTPQQFLLSPQAQETVARTKLGQYAQLYGPEGAAKAWFAGPTGMSNPNATDVNGMTTARYGQNAMTRLASLGPDLPQGAIPAPQGPQNAPAATSGAVSGPLSAAPPVPSAPQGTQVAAGPGGLPSPMPPSPGLGIPGQAPVTPGGTTPSGFFAQRPRISRQQYEALQANPSVTPEEKQFYTNLYLGQGQPTTFQNSFGTVVRAPNGQQQFIGNPVDMSIKGPAGEVPVHGVYNADGSIRILQPMQGGGNAPPSGASAPPPQGAGGSSPSPSAGPPEVPSQVAPGPQGAVPQAMPKFAARETGTMNDAGMLGANPPAPAVKPEPVAGATPAPQPQGPQTAQSMIPQYARDTLNELGTIQAQNNLKTSAATKAGEDASEFVKTMRDKSLLAADEGKKLDLLEGIVHDPSYFSGFASPLVMLKNRMIAGWGGDPKSAANMELADKFMNDLNLDSLKTRLGGLGQIRVFEGNMVQNAFLNRDNSVVANQALVTYAKAVNQRLQQAAEMTNDLLAKNKYVPDPSIQTKVYNYFANKPIMDDAVAKQWNQAITTDAEQRKNTPKIPEPPAGFVPKNKATAPAGPLAVPPPAKPAPPELPL